MNKMKDSLPSCTSLPLSLSSEDLNDLIDTTRDWALMHGLSVRPITNTTKDILQHNYTVYFTNKLFNIYETVINEGIRQKISLGLFRSDLMLETSCTNDCKKLQPFCCWKQVEMNTMASGMAWLGPATTQLHKFVLNEIGLGDAIINLPDNKAIEGLCSGILEAWKIYNDPLAIIIFVVEDFSYNISDQRFHEFEIKRQNPNVKVVRKTLTQLSNQAKLGINNELLINNNKVAVVYYRCGYEPKQYPTQKEWDVRLLIERSLAIKCPSIQYHLAGTKKVQQALANSNVVANYLNNDKKVACIENIFTGLYSLALDENGNAATDMALKYPERFVMKPQREGGGNNIYGKDIKYFLQSIKNPCERTAWILMDKITPPQQLNYLISPNNKIQLSNVVSELGIFGVIIGDENNILINKQAGHIFRTKLTTSNEGGLMSGTAFSDSPYLIDL
ncbi:hypothetical protein HCN44_009564 [Aphidius gifuensis]|uniref:Glutathione synthetase n=1 Tax=Aphidius gifuensis TaxID=684658 RepID=A0A834Y4X7_APHGI|nr:glutathione synthetase-like [Aphidius gifuensis]KAF7998166.1 hypothetical protein HCN44_009564 [Aphidius gifuensis]